MLTLGYRKLIPYPFEVVLSQYFDYEHIAHVHPKTLGEYVVLENRVDTIVFEQRWPKDWLGRRRTSTVEHRWLPPNEMWFEFTNGLHRGVKVHTHLHDRGDATEVEEDYLLPYPDWPFLPALIRPWMMQIINRVWDEDLQVEVCIGGWPGIPAGAPPDRAAGYLVESTPPYDLGPADLLAEGTAVVDGTEVLLQRVGSRWQALEARCPHTGAPLWLGHCDHRTITCPWHGAQFSREHGTVLSGPSPRPLKVFALEEREGRIWFLGERPEGDSNELLTDGVRS